MPLVILNLLFSLIVFMHTLYHDPWTYDVHMKKYSCGISQNINGAKKHFWCVCNQVVSLQPSGEFALRATSHTLKVT